MDNKSFWLANINADSLSVSLIVSESSQFKVASVGKEVLYQLTPESFVTAIDKSLSDSATSVDLPEESEPSSIALIISPFWVGSDGKIVGDKIKLFESMFKELKLRPMGFISYDDAIVEEANISDGFPASFIIVKLEATSFVASLTYLGKVIERIIKPIADSFDPSLLEATLLEFKTDSTLPPQIILLGDIDHEVLEKIKSYPWIGKKNVETFLHFPDIKHFSVEKTTSIFTTAITSQFQPLEVNNQPEVVAEEVVTEDSEIIPSDLSEVSADELGFSETDNFTIPEPLPEITDSVPRSPPKITFKFNLPKIKIPKFKVPSKSIFIYPLAFSPLLILGLFYFSVAKITLYITPYEFNKTIDISLDPQAKVIDATKKIVPINRQTFDVTNTITVTTTGQKTVGQKAQGEVTVYNKQDKVQTLAKGTVLTDSSGHKFELITSAQIASSSSDLSAGVITLGQTKVMVMATDIGSESNLAKDTVLNFKDYPSTVLVAKVSDSLGGGSKNEVKAVASGDKIKAEDQLNLKITSAVSEKITQELNNNPGIIRDSVQIKNGRIDTNREVGEEADELTATATSSVYVFYFDQNQKENLLNTFLSSEPGFKESAFNPDNFEISVSKAKNSIDKVTGTILIKGNSTPLVDTTSVAKLVSGKNQPTAISLIKKSLPRVYNYQISTNFSFLKSINPLPFRLSNIKIEIK